MIVSQPNLEALRTGFNTAFKSGLKAAASKYALLATTVSSSTKVETYGFLGDFPKFRKWVGEKRIRSMKEQAYQLVNDSFENTVGIHKNQIKDDNLGLYGPMAEGWGKTAGKLADQLVFDALKNGHQRLCYDGQNFFDAEHPVGDSAETWSNINTAGAVQPWFLLDCSQGLKPILYQERQAPTFDMVTDPTDSHVFKTGEFLMGGEARGAAGYTYPHLAYRSTATLNEAGYKAAREAMTTLKDDNGEPLGIKPTHLVVGSSNAAAARQLIKAQTLANGAANIWFNDVEVVEVEWLA